MEILKVPSLLLLEVISLYFILFFYLKNYSLRPNVVKSFSFFFISVVKDFIGSNVSLVKLSSSLLYFFLLIYVSEKTPFNIDYYFITSLSLTLIASLYIFFYSCQINHLLQQNNKLQFKNIDKLLFLFVQSNLIIVFDYYFGFDKFLIIDSILFFYMYKVTLEEKIKSFALKFLDKENICNDFYFEFNNNLLLLSLVVFILCRFLINVNVIFKVFITFLLYVLLKKMSLKTIFYFKKYKVDHLEVFFQIYFILKSLYLLWINL